MGIVLEILEVPKRGIVKNDAFLMIWRFGTVIFVITVSFSELENFLLQVQNRDCNSENNCPKTPNHQKRIVFDKSAFWDKYFPITMSHLNLYNFRKLISLGSNI